MRERTVPRTMHRRTKRRAFLGGVVAATVGGAGYVLNRQVRDSGARGRWLRPVDPVSESEEFAYVAAVREGDGAEMDVEIAMRNTWNRSREIALFADSADPVTTSIPPLRGFWRFDAAVGDRDLGEHTLRVRGATLPVELVAESPPFASAGVRLTPRVTWRSDYVAHAHGWETGDGRGRVTVAFRRRTGLGPTLDAVGFRDPEGRLVGRAAVPADVHEVTFTVDPLTVSEADGELVGFRDGDVVDRIPMFYQ